MSNRSSRSLGRRLLPAVAMTGAAAGLIAVLDRPPSGSAGDVVGGPLGEPNAEPVVPDAAPSAEPTQPPTVSSTLPVIIIPADDEDEDVGDDEDDDGMPIVVRPTVPATTVPAAESPPVPAGSCEGDIVDGPSVNTRWGPVQVEAVVSSSGQICDVGAIRFPDSHRRSVRINQEALPILHDQVLNAQSADIRGVSGATVTTDGYVRSLQAILDGGGG